MFPFRSIRAPGAAALAGLLALSASLEAAPNLTWRAAKGRGAVVQDVAYDLDLTLKDKSKTYDGRLVASFRLRRSPLRLHLDFQGETIRSMVVNGTPVPGASIEGGKVWIRRKYLRDGKNRVEIEYTNDFDTDGAGLHKIVDPADGREYVYTDFEPYDANRLFPCFDQPDLKASYTVSVAAPPAWQVVANGRELGQVAEGELVRHRFAETERFSTYIMALCAGPFASWVDPEARIPARIFAVQSMAEYMDAGRIFRVTREGFDFFEKYFEVPYPFHKYDQIFLPQFNSGAMENVAAVTFNGRYVYRHEPTDAELQGRANTILHEMAHMWFGDIVTMQWWNDLWLNESFATYMANLGLVEATRFKDSWTLFTKGTKSWAYWQDQLPTTHPIETDVPDTQTTFTNFDGITYGKGASVLKQLAFYVGPEKFRQGVAAYLKKYRWRNARRADFIASVARAAGKDLGRWTELWLQKSGVNVLRADLEVDKRGRVRRFILRQEKGNGDAVLRPHRLKVAYFDRGKGGKLYRSKVATVEIDGASQRVRALEGRRAPAFVLVNDEDHAYGKTFLDERSLAFAREHLEELPSDVRAAVWNTVWFMVRDGAAAPKVYLDLFLAKAPEEADVGLLRSFRNSLWSVTNRYLRPEVRDLYLKRIHTVARQQWVTLPPGSDAQKTWFDFMVSAAEHREALDEMVALLEGSRDAKGIELGPDRRWDMIARLVRTGHAKGAALRDAEAAKDKGERTQKMLVQLAAAVPSKTAKQAAWRRYLEDKETPLDHLRAGMRSFFHVTHTEHTLEFVDRYFERIPKLLKERDDYFVRTFVGNLFPGSAHISEGVLEASRRFLISNEKELPFYVRRSLLEKNDELERALRLRR